MAGHEDNNDEPNDSSRSFWITAPGLITAIGGLLTAIAVLIGALSAAGVIGGDVARLAVDAAEGAIDAADRITAAAGRAATNLVDATLTGVADIGRRPAQRVAERAESSVAPTADGNWRARPGTPAPRKPLARQPSRVARTVTRTRRRGRSVSC